MGAQKPAKSRRTTHPPFRFCGNEVMFTSRGDDVHYVSSKKEREWCTYSARDKKNRHEAEGGREGGDTSLLLLPRECAVYPVCLEISKYPENEQD